MKNNYLSFLKEHQDIIGETKGLHTNEIQSIEQKFNVTLPVAYKQFLSYFGHDTGSLLNGYCMTYKELQENREDAIYELEFDDCRKDRVVLEEHYFFFAQWQGYSFLFFDCSIAEGNPPVFLFDTEKIVKYKDSFTDFLNDEGLQLLIQSHNQRP